jgi:hypothetical protein
MSTVLLKTNVASKTLTRSLLNSEGQDQCKGYRAWTHGLKEMCEVSSIQLVVSRLKMQTSVRNFSKFTKGHKSDTISRSYLPCTVVMSYLPCTVTPNYDLSD